MGGKKKMKIATRRGRQVGKRRFGRGVGGAKEERTGEGSHSPDCALEKRASGNPKEFRGVSLLGRWKRSFDLLCNSKPTHFP